MTRALGYVDGRLKCSSCLATTRHPYEYQCRNCAKAIQAFNTARRPEHYGVSIFASWPTKVKES